MRVLKSQEKRKKGVFLVTERYEGQLLFPRLLHLEALLVYCYIGPEIYLQNVNELL